MIDRTWARQFAIMECTRSRPNSLSYHYADDVEMRSPLIIERMGVTEGILKRKKERSDRIGNGARRTSPLQFEYVMSLAGTLRRFLNPVFGRQRGNSGHREFMRVHDADSPPASHDSKPRACKAAMTL